MTQRTRAGAFLAAVLLLGAIFGTYCATASAEEDAWDAHGISFGVGGVYVYDEPSDSEIYYDWCGPLNTLRAMNDEGLVPQYSVDQVPWVPFVESVTFTVAGEQGSLHLVRARYVDAKGREMYAAGEMGLRIALDTTGPATKARNAVEVRRYGVATFRLKVVDKGSIEDVVRIVVRKMNGVRVARYFVGRTEIDTLTTFRKKISLPKGRYRWFVRAVDVTGNAQVSVGCNSLIVK